MYGQFSLRSDSLKPNLTVVKIGICCNLIGLLRSTDASQSETGKCYSLLRSATVAKVCPVILADVLLL